ncbi:hypothetical protein [Lacinutrix chionoecetis]
MNEIETFFDSQKSEQDVKFNKISKKWFNGHAYLPLELFIVNYTFEKSSIKIQYEYRQSEFTKPNAVDVGGAYGDRHNCIIKCKLHSKDEKLKFRIIERNLFSKIFKKHPIHFFSVNCSNKKMKSFLKKNKYLNEIYKVVENSPEFSPSISGNQTDSNFEIIIIYSTQQKNVSILYLMEDFYKSVVSFLK